MKVQGYEVFSRATIASARVLLVTSFAVLVFVLLKGSEGELTVLGVPFEQSDASLAAFFAILFLCINHLVNWYSDFSGFQNWNRGRNYAPRYKVNTDPLAELEEVGELEDARRTLLQTVRSYTGTIDAAKNPDFRGLKAGIERVDEKLQTLLRRRDNLNRIAWFNLFVMKLAVPVGLALWAMFVTGGEGLEVFFSESP